MEYGIQLKGCEFFIPVVSRPNKVKYDWLVGRLILVYLGFFYLLKEIFPNKIINLEPFKGLNYPNPLVWDKRTRTYLHSFISCRIVKEILKSGCDTFGSLLVSGCHDRSTYKNFNLSALNNFSRQMYVVVETGKSQNSFDFWSNLNGFFHHIKSITSAKAIIKRTKVESFLWNGYHFIAIVCELADICCCCCVLLLRVCVQ